MQRVFPHTSVAAGNPETFDGHCLSDIKGEKGLETNVTKGVDYLRRGCSAGDKDGCEDVRQLGL